MNDELTLADVWKEECLNAEKFLRERIGWTPSEVQREVYQEEAGHFKMLFRVKEFYDACVPYNGKFEQIYRYTPSGVSEMLKILPSVHKFYPHLNSFLDLGCGSGFPLASALEYKYDAMGVDIVHPILELAKENLRKMGFDPGRIIEADLTSKDFPNMDLNGRKCRDFDLFYCWQPADITFKIFDLLSHEMRPESRLILIRDDTLSNKADFYSALDKANLVEEQYFLRHAFHYIKRKE